MLKGIAVAALPLGVAPVAKVSVPVALWKPVRSSVMTDVSETPSPPTGVAPAANDGGALGDSCGPVVSASPPVTATEGHAALLRSALWPARSATWMLVIVHVPPSVTPKDASDPAVVSYSALGMLP